MAGAILAIWNDYPAEFAEEYTSWHTFEHVPERLTVPGMQAARRYVSASEIETYFTLYDLEDLSVIEQPAYIDLVRNPTPWSLKMRRHFSKVLRIPGKIAATGGHGIGGAANVQAYSVDRREAQTWVLALETMLRHLITQSHLAGFRVALAEPNQIYEVFSQDEGTDPDTMNVVIIAEGESVQSLAALQETLTEQINATLQPRKVLRNDLFTLLISYRGDEFPTDRSEIATTRATAHLSECTDQGSIDSHVSP
ncbi:MULTISPECIES: hypothetical protein [unclassified Rhizobium]|uniref:hypothetical protein n=1 Tax=unclassified Rhizobium TaxID=2613769 RepID=UPI000698604B|nr:MULTISPECIES: hypothetical protein [unclassified Rhizobium]